MFLYLYLRNLFVQEEGQDIVEYAILLGLIAIVAWLAIAGAGTTIQTMWQGLAARLGGITW